MDKGKRLMFVKKVWPFSWVMGTILGFIWVRAAILTFELGHGRRFWYIGFAHANQEWKALCPHFDIFQTFHFIKINHWNLLEHDEFLMIGIYQCNFSNLSLSTYSIINYQ